MKLSLVKPTPGEPGDGVTVVSDADPLLASLRLNDGVLRATSSASSFPASVKDGAVQSRSGGFHRRLTTGTDGGSGSSTVNPL